MEKNELPVVDTEVVEEGEQKVSVAESVDGTPSTVSSEVAGSGDAEKDKDSLDTPSDSKGKDVNVKIGTKSDHVEKDEASSVETEDALKSEKSVKKEENTLKDRELSVEEIRAEAEKILVSSREACAMAEKEWKNKTRENKGFFAKNLEDLKVATGFGRPNEPKKSPEYIEALEAYKAAKKKMAEISTPKKKILKAKDTAGPDGTVDTEEVEVVDREALFAQVEAEYLAYQNSINESLPPLEKGLARKALDKWVKAPKAVRIAAIPVLVGAGSFALGMSSLAAATGYVGYRVGKSAVRSVASAYASKKVGSMLQEKYDKANADERESMEDEFKGKIDLDNFDENSEAIIARLEEFEKTKNRQRTKKVAAQVLTGAGVTGAFFGVEHFAHNTTDAISAQTESSGSIDNHIDDVGHPADLDHMPESGAPAVEAANVELSSKGFIQDVINLKKEVLSKYGDMDHVPQGIKDNLFGKSSVDLAKQYGLYDPEHGLSAMGLKGEHLSVSENGDIIYGDVGGHQNVVFDSTTGDTQSFSHFGKMFIPKPHDVNHPTGEIGHEVDLKHPIESGPADDMDPDYPVGHPVDLNHVSANGVSEAVPVNLEPAPYADVPNYPDGHVPFGNTYVNIVESPEGNKVLLDGYQIAHESNVGNFGKSLVLDDKFQDGAQYAEVRSAFVKALDEKLGPMQISSGTFSNVNGAVNSMPFEGGKIHVLQGLDRDDPHSLGVFLNGKRIATGSMTDKGPDLRLLDEPGIKSGWFKGDTVYERAFKASKKAVKEMSNWSINNKK